VQENPERYVSDLMDCLGDTQRPIGLFIGAGCPCAVKNASGGPLIPSVPVMTSTVTRELEGGAHAAQWAKFKTTLPPGGPSDVTIEVILGRMQGVLSGIGSGTFAGLSASDLKSLEAAICKRIVGLATQELPTTDTPYSQLAAWLNVTDRKTSVHIFTTNYDLLLEQALERRKVPFFDGFVGSSRPFFDPHSVENDDLPRRWLRLWKIHGSMNWGQSTATGQLEVFRESSPDTCVVYPSYLKYDQSRKMPYLAMMDRLLAFLSRPSAALITVGYSFGDEHLNQLIEQGLQGNPSAVVLGLLYDKLEAYPKAQDLGRRLSTLRLHAPNGSITGGQRVDWQVSETKPDSRVSDRFVKWTHSAGPPEQWSSEFLLGDFANLGLLFSQLVTNRVSAPLGRAP
jgi:hypothetical protein